jgi:hypothetical protein
MTERKDNNADHPHIFLFHVYVSLMIWGRKQGGERWFKRRFFPPWSLISDAKLP